MLPNIMRQANRPTRRAPIKGVQGVEMRIVITHTLVVINGNKPQIHRAHRGGRTNGGDFLLKDKVEDLVGFTGGLYQIIPFALRAAFTSAISSFN